MLNSKVEDQQDQLIVHDQPIALKSGETKTLKHGKFLLSVA